MSIKTFFSNNWHNFLNWFTAEEAEVVSDAKTIIDQLVPVVKADILSDAGTAIATVGAALLAGTDPLIAIQDAAVVVWKEAALQGINISKAASTAAGAILVAKSQALAAVVPDVAAAPAPTPSTVSAPSA